MCLELQNKKLLFWKKGQGWDALDGFSHSAYASVRESVRTQDLSHEGHTAFMTCRHSGKAEYSYLNACDCHCFVCPNFYWYYFVCLSIMSSSLW